MSFVPLFACPPGNFQGDFLFCPYRSCITSSWFFSLTTKPPTPSRRKICGFMNEVLSLLQAHLHSHILHSLRSTGTRRLFYRLHCSFFILMICILSANQKACFKGSISEWFHQPGELTCVHRYRCLHPTQSDETGVY